MNNLGGATEILQRSTRNLIYTAGLDFYKDDVLPLPLEICDDPASGALDLFQQRFSVEATHLAYAPGRVNLIGEHTDYNGGFVLPMAIERGIYIAARKRADRFARILSPQAHDSFLELDLRVPIRIGMPAWTNYVRGVVAGFQESDVGLPGFDASIFANLPAGGGLSSSAALELAVATMCESLAGITLDRERKALLCQHAEHVFAGTPCGIMDQFAVTFAEAGHLLLIDCRSRTRELVPMEGEDASILVINTMVKHELADGGYAERRADCHEAASLLGVGELREATPALVEEHRGILSDRLLRRARHITTENERTLRAVEAFRRADWRAAGELMYESHASLRDDFEVSCKELDLVVDAARALGISGGVFGCRMTGGGFGGCCVALVQPGEAGKISESIRANYHDRTGIDPAIFTTKPAAGAAILMEL